MNEIRFTYGKIQQVSKIIGVGKNYAAHAAEMNSKPPGEPVIFLKPPTSLADMEAPIHIPKSFGSVHYELELAVCISRNATNIDKEKAKDYILGYGMALDLTLRDVQKKAKDQGHPWALAKGFDGSCPVSAFQTSYDISDVSNLTLWLRLNGEERQNSSTSKMLFSIDELIAYITQFITLFPGDLILTGTPAGVGHLSSGDEIQASISGIASIQTNVV